MKKANIARQTVPLPMAPPEYSAGDEQQFRMMLEQEIQRIYAVLGEIRAEIAAL